MKPKLSTRCTPAAADGLGVFVYIHGGGYVAGMSQYDMGFLAASQNMVFIAIQYRLNVLGYFATNSDDSWGNYGLFDQTGFEGRSSNRKWRIIKIH